MTIKIDKNIPITPPRGRLPKYPFAQMEVGDSFKCKKQNVAQIAYQFGKRNDMTFASRSCVGGFRIWRIK